MRKLWIAAVAPLVVAGCKDCGDAAFFDAAKVELVEHLRSPGSAVWPEVSELTVESPVECVATLSGWVDSQNGFGALVRSEWAVTVVDDGTGPRAVVLSFEERR